MKEMAQDELEAIAVQKSALEAQFIAIEESEKEEEEFPNEIILEARAGAGGEEVVHEALLALARAYGDVRRVAATVTVRHVRHGFERLLGEKALQRT